MVKERWNRLIVLVVLMVLPFMLQAHDLDVTTSDGISVAGVDLVPHTHDPIDASQFSVDIPKNTAAVEGQLVKVGAALAFGSVLVLTAVIVERSPRKLEPG